MSDWRLGKVETLGDAALCRAVIDRFSTIRDRDFADDPFINRSLAIEIRALRRMETWCVFLVLTPWMLARIFLPERDPGLRVPIGWLAGQRADAPYEVIGPCLELALLGGMQQAHINYDEILGHYLVQPLVLTMARFDRADAVFQAWNEVIATRQKVMEEQRRDCPWQRELSRREFFARFSGHRT